MAAFDYVAINPNGKKEKGIIAADSLEIARRELRNRKLAPIKVSEVSSRNFLFRSFQRKISLKNLVIFTRQLSALTSGGVVLDRALKLIGDQSSNSQLKEHSLTLASRIEEGFSFTEALKEFPQSFDRLFISLVSAGEKAGDMAGVLDRTASYLERKSKIQQDITGALIYPAVLLSLAFIIVSLMLIFVVPSVVDQFANLNQELPLITRWLIGLSNFISGPALWILLILVLSLLFSFRFFGVEKLFTIVDKYLLKIPVLKGFLINSNLARFTTSLSILRNNDIPIVQALEISTATISNSHLRSNLEKSLSGVSEGNSLAQCLSSVPQIPPMVTQLVASGERSGELENMLSKAADFLDMEFQQSTKIAMNLLEPMVVVIMGTIVASIVVAVLLPLIQMNNLSLIG
ncbi:MAG: type II secretion system F family protein [SAR86 cluster bacterium]|nr:type II secretion system F family protein [SAR86 cluster bacterium]